MCLSLTLHCQQIFWTSEWKLQRNLPLLIVHGLKIYITYINCGIYKVKDNNKVIGGFERNCKKSPNHCRYLNYTKFWLLKYFFCRENNFFVIYIFFLISTFWRESAHTNNALTLNYSRKQDTHTQNNPYQCQCLVTIRMCVFYPFIYTWKIPNNYFD